VMLRYRFDALEIPGGASRSMQAPMSVDGLRARSLKYVSGTTTIAEHIRSGETYTAVWLSLSLEPIVGKSVLA
jgi:hypothetical protein